MKRMVLVVLTLPCVSVWAQEPPRGWYLPNPEAVRLDPLRGNSPTSFLRADADFDGDGQADRAAIFVSPEGIREDLFVWLSSDGSGEWQLAAESQFQTKASVLRMGISVAAVLGILGSASPMQGVMRYYGNVGGDS